MRSLMTAPARLVNSVADRFVSMVVPGTVARAADCDYECSCSNPGYWRYCCYYASGRVSCGGCSRDLHCG
jgi:hypothetical protein